MSKDFEVIRIDPGNKVNCDLCNESYEDDEESTGGIYFAGHAVCPKCLPETLKSIKKYHEEKYIKAEAKPGETFRDFVYRLRKGDY
jgi:hydrogenase maturation factor HypF (carbamoyltransferase family)